MPQLLTSPDLGTVTVLMLLTTTLVLWLNWRVHARIAGTGWWFLAHLSFVGCALLLELRGQIPETLSILGGNTLLVIGYLLMLRGTCVFAGVAPPSKSMVALVLAVLAGFAYYTIVQPSYVARWWVLGSAMTAQALWSLAVPQRRVAGVDGLLGAGMYGLATVAVTVVMLSVPASLSWRETGVTHLFQTSGSKSWGLTLATVILALQTFGVVLMTANRVQRELQRQATVDALTGLPNRRAFDDALQRTMETAGRSAHAVGLLLIDIDHFKRINDTLGHAQGDAVLREVARRVSSTLRHAEQAARIGGEEFAAILTDPDDASLRDVAERVRESVRAQPVSTARGPRQVTVSVGAARLTAPGPDELRRLFHDADEALYAAKRDGRDRVMLAAGA